MDEKVVSYDRVVDLLRRTRTKIASGWVQGSNAVDCKGRAVTSTNPRACKWCLLGALVYSTYTDYEAYKIAYKALNVAVGADLAKWNDWPGRTQKDVLNVIDSCINSLTM